ncbi:MAG: hypothetical protein AB1640_12780 [bacterium]
MKGRSEPADLSDATLPDRLPAQLDGSAAEDREEALDFGRVQLLLAEKRTSLAALRTGIALFTLPLSVATVLITTSRFYDFFANLHYLVPLLVLCAALVLVAGHLILSSLVKFNRESRQVARIKSKSAKWKELLD